MWLGGLILGVEDALAFRMGRWGSWRGWLVDDGWMDELCCYEIGGWGG